MISSVPRRDMARSRARVLVIDNRDSFVFNLVEDLRRHGAQLVTIRSNISLESLSRHLSQLDPHLVVLSPGPGRPEDSGVMVPWLRTRPETPVLGVCLGHQALVVAFGGRVAEAPRQVHGRASRIDLCPDPIFEGIASPLVAGRYHSLIATEVPEEMRVIATTNEHGVDLVMGVRHRRLCQVGLQFHPESILTPQGGRILWNFVQESLRLAQKSRSTEETRP